MQKLTRLPAILGIGFVLLAAPGGAVAGTLRAAGPEFEPSTVEAPEESGASIAQFADGRFVVAWIRGHAGCCLTAPVVARVFEPTGVPVGPEVVIGESGYGPQLTIVPPGDRFILTTSWAYGPGEWRLFDESLTAQGPEVPIAIAPDLAANLYGTIIDGDGKVEILCRYYSASPPARRLQIQRYLLDGTPSGSPTIVYETPTDGEGEQPFGIVATSDGNVAVVWSHFDITPAVYPYISDKSYSTGWMRRYTPSGATVGSDFSFTGGELAAEGQLGGTIDADGIGHIILLGHLTQHYSDGTTPPPLFKRFSLDGSSSLDLPPPPLTWQDSIGQVTASADGRIVIAYSAAQSGSVQRYSPDGSMDGSAVGLVDNLLLRGGATAVTISTAGSVIAASTVAESNTSYGVRVRRYCDSDDAGCKLCPAYDDTVDNDGDGVPDGCDPCNVFDSGQVPTRSFTRVAYGGTTEPSMNFIPVKSNRVKLSQRFVLPAGTTFADLPVEADGFRLRIESADGGAMVDISVPGGAYAGKGTAGWLHKGTKIMFLDRTKTPVNGLRRITISDLDANEPGLVSVAVNAASGAYAVNQSFPPIKAILVFGGLSSASSGLCSETQYSPDDCEFDYAYSARISCESQ